MKKGELYFVLAMILPLIPGVIMGFTGHGWYYFLTVFTFYLCFGFYEWRSVATRKKSISQDIGKVHKEKPWLFWFLVISWTLMHVAITIHWWSM